MARVGGLPMIGHVLARLKGCEAVAVSARPGSMAAAYGRDHGLPVLFDAEHHPEGPLAGVCAGLEWAEKTRLCGLISLPCDVPFAPEDLVARLALSKETPAFAASPNGDHPLCAYWPIWLRSPLRAELDAGRHRSVLGVLHSAGAARHQFADDAAFVNANTPDALAQLEVSACRR